MDGEETTKVCVQCTCSFISTAKIKVRKNLICLICVARSRGQFAIVLKIGIKIPHLFTVCSQNDWKIWPEKLPPCQWSKQLFGGINGVYCISAMGLFLCWMCMYARSVCEWVSECIWFWIRTDILVYAMLVVFPPLCVWLLRLWRWLLVLFVPFLKTFMQFYET